MVSLTGTELLQTAQKKVGTWKNRPIHTGDKAKALCCMESEALGTKKA
jgi:hypothetical protein